MAGKPGVRLNPRNTDAVLAKIKTIQLTNRLQNHALGKLKKPMEDSQVRAASFLIERLLARAAAPLDLNVNGTIIVEERDPTARPDGYTQQRRRLPAP